MERRALGSFTVSVIGLGCNNFGQRLDKDQTSEVVHAALAMGINYFDTSDNYGAGTSEEYLGRALKDRRDEAIVSTKYDGPAAVARASCLSSLDRLGMDHLDLFQIHHPYPGEPVSETLGALGDLVTEGLVREIGCSNFSVPELRTANEVEPASVRFTSVQNDYNLLNRKQELDVIPECRASSVAFNAYFPLYHGLLTGKFRRGEPLLQGTRLAEASEARKAAVFTAENFDVVERLAELAARYSKTLLDLALARPLHVDGVTSVITGASTSDQVQANVKAGEWSLTEEMCNEVDTIAPVRSDARDTPSAVGGIP